MMDALNFIQNQAGTMSKKVYAQSLGNLEVPKTDQISVYDVVQRVKIINRAFERQNNELGEGGPGEAGKANVSFL